MIANAGSLCVMITCLALPSRLLASDSAGHCNGQFVSKGAAAEPRWTGRCSPTARRASTREEGRFQRYRQTPARPYSWRIGRRTPSVTLGKQKVMPAFDEPARSTHWVLFSRCATGLLRPIRQFGQHGKTARGAGNLKALPVRARGRAGLVPGRRCEPRAACR